MQKEIQRVLEEFLERFLPATKILKSHKEANKDVIDFLEQSLKQVAREAIECVIPEEKQTSWAMGQCNTCGEYEEECECIVYDKVVADMKEKASNLLKE